MEVGSRSGASNAMDWKQGGHCGDGKVRIDPRIWLETPKEEPHISSSK